VKRKVGILISGRGSNMTALIEAARDPDFPAEIALVLSNRADAGGLERAAGAGLATAVIDHKAFPDRASFDAAMDARLRAAGVEWVELGGVKPNPRLSLVHEGVKLCKQHQLGLILAVGGGSVIDSAKAIAMGAVIDHDVWDFYLGKGAPQIQDAAPGLVMALQQRPLRRLVATRVHGGVSAF